MKRIKALLRSRWIQHPAFWVLSFVIFLRLFGYAGKGFNPFSFLAYFETDLIYTFLFHFSIWWVVYINLDLLLPRFFQKGRYWLYGLSLVLVLASGIILNFFTFNVLTDWIFPDYYFISYHTWWDLTQILGVYILVTTLIKLSKSWFQLRAQEKQLNELEKQNLNAELSGLKAQLHPHFLFNHLNTLYSLALDQDPKTADYVLRLSDHLRHLTYNSNGETVSLDEELEWMKNYLALQEIKGGRDYQLNIQGVTKNKRIPPLLLLPLLENAFKHGDLNKSPLQLEILADKNALQFRLENSVRQHPGDLPGGIGLANLKRRLELLFPNEHTFSTSEENNRFLASLNIPYQ